MALLNVPHIATRSSNTWIGFSTLIIGLLFSFCIHGSNAAVAGGTPTTKHRRDALAGGVELRVLPIGEYALILFLSRTVDVKTSANIY